MNVGGWGFPAVPFSPSRADVCGLFWFGCACCCVLLLLCCVFCFVSCFLMGVILVMLIGCVLFLCVLVLLLLEVGFVETKGKVL